ncbi:ATP-binding cassette domain-containing protein [Rathayibacter sp. VKM Ac-2803]|uniref:ATP-binding cassette domain-containing protein n=1 Tax=Rathayibacter sp. VKM Ac-2803 TaxID=2609256 RepID=UPI001359C985|nr:ABC transporter ATP-binding protein [Rathayibacter sp. VKM Ac-2803]MWV48085.1 ATP-binding cassette domain-containing protein [Rathayibacter sp. VKM Ac-2803]
MPAAATVEDLTVVGDRRTLLRNVSFEVGVGERVALLGASGSGKSLTAAAVLGALPPTFSMSGSVSLFGRPVVPGRTPPAGLVAAVFQDSSLALNPFVTVGRQLVSVLRAHRDLGRREAAAAVTEVLHSVGIQDPERAMRGFAPELSGGQRQRICIGLALLCGARLLVADEPTTALDVVTQAQVLRVLREYGAASDAALLFITHDLAVASILCTRAVVLERGAVVEAGPMADLVAAPAHPFTRSLVDAARSLVREDAA